MNFTMDNLCIIPARGGSKRIPRKNIRDFLGKPIIAYSIEKALKSNLFGEVMVSTDDNEIAEMAKSLGASVPFIRSTKNSDDYSPTIEVLKEVLNEYLKRNASFEYCCCIYPTAPLIDIDRLIEGYNLLIQGHHDTVFPVVAFSYPIWRGLKINNEGLTKMIWPENLSNRSQDLDQAYHDAGQWYWMKAKVATEGDSLFTANTKSILLNELEVQDIDNISDWKLAELKYELLQRS